jgi:hypothetical protein
MTELQPSEQDTRYSPNETELVILIPHLMEYFRHSSRAQARNHEISAIVKVLEEVNPKKWTDPRVRIWFHSNQRRYFPRLVDHGANPASARFSDWLPSFAPPPQYPFDPALRPPLTEKPEGYFVDDILDRTTLWLGTAFNPRSLALRLPQQMQQ